MLRDSENMDSDENLGNYSEVVAASVHPRTAKMLTDPYNACMQWAFGRDWRTYQEQKARMMWEFRHSDLCKQLPLSWKEAMVIITRLWAEAVRSGADLEQDLKDAIDRAAEAMGE